MDFQQGNLKNPGQERRCGPTKKIGYSGALIGIKDDGPKAERKPSTKIFSLSYDPGRPILYSPAKVKIGGKRITTDKAMWDTGATISAISRKAAAQTNTAPSASGTMIGATGSSGSNIYLATLWLPGGIVFHDVEVWDAGLSGLHADVVIGMNVISRGKLVVETVDGIPMFSFSVIQ